MAAKLLCGELAGWEARLISPKQEERWPESKFELFFSQGSQSSGVDPLPLGRTVSKQERKGLLASMASAEELAAARLFDQIVSPNSYPGS